MAAASNETNLSIVDISSLDLTKSASLIRQACLDSGFFYAVNHGISEELLEELFRQSRKFFELPVEDKMKALMNNNFRGYTPLMSQTLDPSKQTQGDSKEGYFIGVDVAKDDPHASRRFSGPNVWPSADLLSGWRETMEEYHQEAFAFIVNIGDMLERWSNNVFRSTLHRVLLSGQERYSAPSCELWRLFGTKIQ